MKWINCCKDTKLSKLTKKEIENQNRLIKRDWISNKTSSTKKSPEPNGFTGEFTKHLKN